MNRKLVMLMTAALAVGMAFGQTRGKAKKVVSDDGETTVSGKDAYVHINLFPKLGRQSTQPAPFIPGASTIGPCYTKQRKWIVLETKYTTQAKFQDQLTFTWHVLLETKSATEKDKNDELPPYSYFTTTVTYYNVPKGAHAASVCLPPSYLERYGEPKAIGLVIANKDGLVLAGDCESEIGGIDSHPKDIQSAFWNNQEIMNMKDKKTGNPMIEFRQGLLERSKTIWALVNPNDYETTLQ